MKKLIALTLLGALAVWGGAMTIHYASAAATVPTQAEVNALVKQYLADTAPKTLDQANDELPVTLYAVFYDKDRVVNAMQYNKLKFLTVSDCHKFFTTGGDDQFKASLQALHPVVTAFAQDHPGGAVRIVCTDEEHKPKLSDTNI